MNSNLSVKSLSENSENNVYFWDSGPDEKENRKTATPDSDRGGWSNKLDFLFSCISVSVGLGNVWRFPYLCYKNGGGAFLVTYTIAMIFCGIPMFFQEVAIGQYLGVGGMNLVGTLCPILQGTGYATMTIVFLLDVYYCIIISWTLFYLLSTFTRLPELPWAHCDNWWNTESCYEGETNTVELVAGKKLNDTIKNVSVALSHNATTTPVEEYWERRVLMISDGITDLAGMQWELFCLLLLGWVIIYFIIFKGISQSGKIIWFTALFPYVIMFALLCRSISLEGAVEGLKYFVTPDWSKLATAGAWIDGATQIFFAYSIGVGTLPALGSYNNFHHNCYKDAIITCIVNTLTSILAGCITFSILGYIAFTQNTSVDSVVATGPGLVFITYPEVVLQLPGAPIWAAIFFVMLAILGIDSGFCNVESFVTGVVDHWPEKLRSRRRLFTFGVCFVMFLLGIPMVTHGGAYIFQLMDFYAASGMPLLWVCFFQTIAISWIFGADKFSDCVYQMTGIRPSRFWRISWVYLAPCVMLGVFLFFCVKYEPVTYANKYHYPVWGEVLGLFISLSSMLWIPGYAVYYLLKTPGSLADRIKTGLTPKMNLGRGGKSVPPKFCPPLPLSESSVVLINNNQLSRNLP